MSTTSEPKSDASDYEKAEELLVSTAYWPILSSKLAAYFPFTIKTVVSKENRKWRRLQWQQFSWSTLFAFLIVILTTAWMLFFSTQSHYWTAYLKAFKISSEPETYSLGFLTACLGVYAIAFRARALLTGEKFMNLWRGNVELLSKFQIADPDAPGNESQSEAGRMLLNKLRLRSQIIVFTIWITWILVSVVVCFCMSADWVIVILVLIWSYNAQLYHSYSLLIACFPRVYTTCFSVLHQRFKEICFSGPEQVCKMTSFSFWSMRKLDTKMFAPTDIKFPTEHSAGIQQIKCENGNFQSRNLMDTCFPNSATSNGNHQSDGGGKAQIQNRTPIDRNVNICIDLYYEVDKELKNYNSFFGPVLVTQILIDVLVLLLNSFFILKYFKVYGAVLSEYQVPLAAFNLIVFGAELFALATVGDDVQKIVLDIADMFSFLPLNSMSGDTKIRIKLLAAKIVGNPTLITPCGFFVLSRRLIISVLSALATYLIVLIQFELPDPDAA